MQALGAGDVDGAARARPSPEGRKTGAGEAAAAGGGSQALAGDGGRGGKSQTESRHHVGFEIS